MKKVSIIFIFLLVIYGCFRSTGTPEEVASREELENLLLSNVLNTEIFDFPTGIGLVDERGEKVSVDSVFC